jgi:hypothetical protein
MLTSDLMLSLHASIADLNSYDGSQGYGFTDTTVQMKYALNSSSSVVRFALIPEVTLPTGSVGQHLSFGGFGWGMRLAADHDFGVFKLAGDVGFRNNPGAVLLGLDYEHQLLLSLGTEIPLSRRVSLNVEGSGYASLPFSRGNSPGEYYFGALYALSQSSILSGGVSTSGISAGGNEGVRAIVGVKFFPNHDNSSRLIASDEPSRVRGPSCTQKPFRAVFPSRAMTEQELAQVGPLPYNAGVEVQSKKRTMHIQNLSLGEMTGVTEGGIPFVEDGQIPFAIELTGLPERSQVVRIDDAQIKMKVTKVSHDHFRDTEMLCFLGRNVCSGGVMPQKNWHDAVNWQYFFPWNRTANTYFSDRYLGHAVGKTKGHEIYSGDLALELKDLLGGSDLTAEDILLPVAPGATRSPSHHAIFLDVANDTFISSDARLEVLMTVEVCE